MAGVHMQPDQSNYLAEGITYQLEGLQGSGTYTQTFLQAFSDTQIPMLPRGLG